MFCSRSASRAIKVTSPTPYTKQNMKDSQSRNRWTRKLQAATPSQMVEQRDNMHTHTHKKNGKLYHGCLSIVYVQIDSVYILKMSWYSRNSILSGKSLFFFSLPVLIKLFKSLAIAIDGTVPTIKETEGKEKFPIHPVDPCLNYFIASFLPLFLLNVCIQRLEPFYRFSLEKNPLKECHPFATLVIRNFFFIRFKNS